MTFSLDTVKLCASKYYIERSQGQCKKIIQNWEKQILIILEILWNYCGIESREGVETLRTMFRMPHGCLIFYCLSLDFFVVFQDKLQYQLVMAFYVLQHGWYVRNNSMTALFNMLATS